MLRKSIALLLSMVIAEMMAILVDNIFLSNQLSTSVVQTIVYVVPFGIVLMILFDQEKVLVFNWWWHRFWIELELKNKYENELKLKSSNKFDISFQMSLVDVLLNNQRVDLISLIRNHVFKKTTKPLIISGDSGSGKSFAVIQSSYFLIKKALRWGGFNYPIPIIVYADKYSGNLVETIARTISYFTPGRDGAVLSKGVDELFRRGKFLIVIDGIEQTLEENHRKIIDDIELFANSSAYNGNHFVITCQTGYISHYFNSEKISYELLEVQDLSDRAVNAIIDLYKPDIRDIESKDEISKLFPDMTEENKTNAQYILQKLREQNLLDAKGLARNVYWLSLMVSEGIFDSNPSVILDRAVNQLLRRERAKAGKRINWNKVEPFETQVFQTRRSLTFLAFHLVSNGKFSSSYDETLALLQSILDNEDYRELTPDDVIGLCQDAQLIDQTYWTIAGKKSSIQFRHSLLLNFLAACELFSDDDLVSQHIEGIVNRPSYWWGALMLYAKLVDALDGSLLWDKRQVIQNELDKFDNLNSGLVRFCSYDRLSHSIYNDKVFKIIHSELTNPQFTDEKIQLIGQVASLLPKEFSEMIGNLNIHSGVERNARRLFSYLVQNEVQSGHGTSLLFHLTSFVSPGEFSEETRNHTVGKIVTDALVALGENSLEPLFELLALSGNHHVFLVLSSLERIKNNSATPKIINFIGSSLKVLDNLEPTTRISRFNQIVSAINALGEIADPRAAQILVILLKLENDIINVSIKNALAKMGEAGAVELLSLAAKDDTTTALYFSSIPVLLSNIGAPAIPHLKKGLSSYNSSVQITSMLALSLLKDESCLEEISKIVVDGDINTQSAALSTLGLAGAKHARLLLNIADQKISINGIWLQKNYNENKLMTNRYVALTLGSMGVGVLDTLYDALKHSNVWVRVCALEAIGFIKSPKSLQQLIVLTETDDVRIKNSIIACLLRQGTVDAVKVLNKYTDSDYLDYEYFEGNAEIISVLNQIKIIDTHNVFMIFNILVSLMANENLEAKKYVEKISRDGFGFHDSVYRKYFKMQAKIELYTLIYAGIIERAKKIHEDFSAKMTNLEDKIKR